MKSSPRESEATEPTVLFGVVWSLVSFLASSALAQSASITLGPISTVAPGAAITLNWTVTNLGGVARTFGVGAEIRQGQSVLADLGARTTDLVPPGGSTVGAINHILPAGWSNGTYIARAAVWTGTPGASTWLNSFDRNFTVQQVTLTLPGRIAFHRDSDNHSLHPPAGADDGHVFILDLASGLISRITSGLNLGNCLNPHFSPDGAALTFMAIPSGQPLSWAQMHLYVLDLAEGSPPLDLGLGQDPKFAPDGWRIVFKRADGQLHRINRDGTGEAALTSGGAEKSGPNFSPVPGDERIVFWKTTVVGPTRFGDIAWRLPDGTEQILVNGSATRYCYYPIWRDADRILFTASEGGDDLCQYSVSNASSAPLTAMNTSADESDPFSAADLVGFSSTRPHPGGGGYDLYLARDDGSALQEITTANSALHELGGAWSPFANARKVTLLAPADGAHLIAAARTLLTVRCWSNGAPWTNAVQRIVFDGPSPAQFAALRDDGTNGDSVAGDGTYSAWVTLPAAVGTYSVEAVAESVEDGNTNSLRSTVATVSLTEARLTIARSSSDVVLSWPASAVGFSLESASSVQATSWLPVLPAPTMMAGECKVTNTTSGGTQFYRLKGP